MLIVLFTLSGMLGWLLLSALMSGLETAAYGANRARLQQLAEGGDPAAKRSLYLLANMTGLISTVLVGNNIVNYMASYTFTQSLQDSGVESPEIWVTVIMTPFFFIFGESLPKRIAYVYSNPALLSAGRLLLLLRKIFWPVCVVLDALSSFLWLVLKKVGLARQELYGKNLLAESLESSMAEGSLSSQQHQMAQRIMALEKMTIGDVMLPTRQAITVGEDESCQVAGERIMDMGYARALLTDRRGTLTGKLVTLNAIMRNPASLSSPVHTLAMTAMRLDVRTPLIRAIHQMREEGSRLAVAVNSGGTPVGAVRFTLLLGYVTGSIRL